METMGLQTSAVFPDVGEEFPQTMTGPPRHTAARAQQLVVGGQPVRPRNVTKKNLTSYAGGRLQGGQKKGSYNLQLIDLVDG